MTITTNLLREHSRNAVKWSKDQANPESFGRKPHPCILKEYRSGLRGEFPIPESAKRMRFAHTTWVPMLLAWGIAVIALAMFRGESSFDGYLALVKSRDVLHGTVGQIAFENAAMQSEILKLKESPSYARKVLRDKYHVAEQDENIVFFAD